MKKLLFFGASMLVAHINAQTTVFNEPFTPGFTTLPTDWSKQDLDGDGMGWASGNYSYMNTGTMGFSGGTALSLGTSNFNNLLISPTITLPSGTDILTFKVGGYSYTSTPVNCQYAIYVLPDAMTYTSSSVPVLTDVIVSGGMATTKTINLSSFAGQPVKLYFRHYGSGLQGFFLDDVNVASTPLLGTSEVGGKEEVGIYPNPATDFINIKSKADILSANIYDATGRKISTHAKTSAIDVRNLQNGSYILEVETKQGKFSNKFIKK